MGRVFAFSRRSFVAAMACGVALLASGWREAAAGPITFTITTSSVTDLDISAFVTVSPDLTQATVDTTGLNGLLGTLGSAYQFTNLGGNSNYTGTAVAGTLNMSGLVTSLGTGDTTLIITETQDGFGAPTGPSGELNTTVTGNFNLAGAGNSQSVNSMYGGGTSVTAGPADFSSTKTTPDSFNQAIGATIASFTTPYSLTNTISFTIPTAGATDTFTVNTQVTTVAVPEPVGVVSLSVGLPLALLAAAWKRRRGQAEAHAA
ncbi:hypothetical protein OJF2_31250 [Aquisphaera giovannonii]|uniref:PEP-CTERM protein-sorting domain-containing protein n=1 Tax=Aquisphaera giovannonii TaxID=406548 RepID=A0A5B9W2X2_9BACT|nr:hypothetical protein [Aquisphaera giovannonii]QEH34584.1 hypothetical protein OJF2_31250 [Aquisphaera giovannonii]